MKKTLAILLITLSLVFSACEGQSENIERNISNIKAEKIELFHFHGTLQCWSCKILGEYAEKTVQDRFPNELKNETIVFKSINLDLAENKELVKKFQAVGSSLFINAISNGKDHIEEEVMVWRLLSDEISFKNYLETRLKTLL